MDSHNQDINAIHSRDLDKFLRQVGLLEQFNAGQVTCKFCKGAITRENLYSILPESGAFNFICERGECVRKLFEHMDDKKK